MKSAPILPARLEHDAHGVPFAPDYGDVYHPHVGALVQAEHVFLCGNELPQRWRGRERFVVLETGFGLGNNFLAAWHAWRHDAQRCTQLQFISVERHPLTRADLARVHAASPLPDLAAQLIDAWPPLTPNLHRLSFDDGKVQLLLALGDVAAWLPELVARVDAFFLDGFAPDRNPAMWQPSLFKAMGRMAAPQATLATWTAARVVREGLTAAGFQVRRADGIGDKRDITLAQFSPVFTPRHAVARALPDAVRDKRALVVGAGLAGCATAWALVEQGWRCTLFDELDAVARAASGNPGGMFHGIVNAQDGAHARFNRAAALQAQRVVQHATRHHAVQGSVDGMLQLQTASPDVAAMQAQLARLGMPADYVQALTAAQAGTLCGIALRHPAWFYPGGGWVDPGGLARGYVARAGEFVQFSSGVRIHRLRRAGALWQLLDAQGGLRQR